MFCLATTLALANTVVAVSPSSDCQDHIKNAVVPVQGNRSFDLLFGDLSYCGDIDNIRNLHNNQYRNQPTAGSVSPDDLNHGLTGVTCENFSMYHPDETIPPSQVPLAETMNLTHASEVINYIPEEMIPILCTLAENYVLFGRWFCDVPGTTNPNRAYMTSGACYGHGRNQDAFSIFGLPQCLIFQKLDENKTWTKSIYEALHGSPQWENTLFLLTFDEHGRSHLISPWVKKGALETMGENGLLKKYSHSSLAGFASKLWDLNGGVPFSARVGSAATFEHLVTNHFRDDTRATLPDPWGY
ncbi:hypothetical protein PAXRUDRAFT_793439 [Paxillus rubicundulus Ve08.2h10]|uniref:Acid phosphatase n=1 Tax=Paxillus rubicundulus Ve08.2h10 TaxID=930991 RepID=A0A0D0DLS1_9AGAM|nr:hypothetical protein PAXRUDRAFT_793439 [Paxillus rubicundulus Ve08.2h10]